MTCINSFYTLFAPTPPLYARAKIAGIVNKVR